MTRHTILTLTGALSIAAAAALAQDAAVSNDPPAEEMQAAETPEQLAARELCTETAAAGAHSEWTIVERITCENSFSENCRIVRKSDGAKASHTCYEPLPMPEAQAEESAASG